MIFHPKIKIGDTISNNELIEYFQCGNMGGMRKINANNALVIVSDHTKGLYDDRWEGKTLHYTGMGSNGDQDLNFSQNKTLAESNSNEIQIFLFEVFKKNEYLYEGRVKLVADPYQEFQVDSEGRIRKVWMFPVSLSEIENPLPIKEKSFESILSGKIEEVQKLNDAEILLRAKSGNSKVGFREVVRNEHIRNPSVIEFAKRRAKGLCDLCEKPAPFMTQKGEPYLEVHHIKWLANGGEDSVENTVALCPNCHRRMHSLNATDDINKLLLKSNIV